MDFMNFPLGADVHCKDGRCGRSTYIILNPISEQITHIVVEEQQPNRIERLVPTSLVVTTAAEGIILNCDRDEFSKLEPFNQTYFVHSDLPHYATDPKLTLLWPFAVSTERTVDISIRSIPEGELAVHRGAKVLATGGAIGRVDEFLVNPESCQITHLVVREDRPRKDNLIIVPLSLIDQIKENEVYLKVEKVIVEEIPDNQIKRQW